MATVSKRFLDEMQEMEAPEPVYADRWDPEKSPVIAGPVVQIEDVETNNGAGTRVTLDDQGPDQLGAVNFFLNTVLRNQFAQQGIVTGSVIGIKYFGEAESRAGRTYKNFGVKVQDADNPEKQLPGTTDDEDPFGDE